jgi:predicted glycoside hydrolase/deacetylase ChbG (UPF0249 family)
VIDLAGHDVIRRVWYRGIDIRKSPMSAKSLRDRGSPPMRASAVSTISTRNESASQVSLADFLQSPGSGMLIMCHPRCSDLELRRIDSLTTKRNAELAFLLSDEWPQLLLRIDFSLSVVGGSANIFFELAA